MIIINKQNQKQTTKINSFHITVIINLKTRKNNPNIILKIHTQE